MSPQQILGSALGTTTERNTTTRAPAASSPRAKSNPTSPLLDHVRGIQRDAQENRTRARVRELMGRDSSPSRSGAEASNLISEHPEVTLRSSPVHQNKEVSVKKSSFDTPTSGGIPIFTGVPLRSAMFDSPESSAVPPTAARRNVTQRRSRDRERDDGEAPNASLLSRRPRSRSKDRRYSLESVGEPLGDSDSCENREWRAARSLLRPKGGGEEISPRHPYPPGLMSERLGYAGSSSGKGVSASQSKSTHRRKDDLLGGENRRQKWDTTTNLANRVPSSTRSSEGCLKSTSESLPLLDPTTPFLREYIPAENTHPELHRSLSEKWYERQEAVRGMKDALAEDDSGLYADLQAFVTHINSQMYEELQDAMDLVTDLTEDESSPELLAESKFCHIDTLPLPVESPERGSELKKSYKESSPGVFTIQFTYQGVEAYRVANDEMPLQTLYIMARSFLRTDFGFRILSEDEVDLYYNEQWLERHGGVLADVPVLQGAVITVVYPRQGPEHANTPQANTPRRYDDSDR